MGECRLLNKGLIPDRSVELRHIALGSIVLELLRNGRQKDHRRAQEFQQERVAFGRKHVAPDGS